jgi:hypothetical protein
VARAAVAVAARQAAPGVYRAMMRQLQSSAPAVTVRHPNGRPPARAAAPGYRRPGPGRPGRPVGGTVGRREPAYGRPAYSGYPRRRRGGEQWARRPGVQWAARPGAPQVQRPGAQWVQRPGAPQVQRPGAPQVQRPGAPQVQRPGAPQVQRPGARWGRRPYQWWQDGYEPTWDVEPEPSATRVDVPGYGAGYGPVMSGRWIRRGRKIIVFGA